MNHKWVEGKFMALVVLTLGGIGILLLTFFLYYGVVLFGEQVLYRKDPSAFPMDQARFFTLMGLVIVIVLIQGFMKSNLLRALLLISPFTMGMVVMMLRFYETPMVGASVVAAFVLLLFYFLSTYKKTWHFYYGAVFSFLVALLYSWPR